jgi:archaellum biogenesis ATPase FlaH
MIDVLNTIALNSDELHQEAEFLIEGFLLKRMITMFYADGGNGKTWLSYATASYLCENNLAKAVYYLDFDNGIVTLKERQVDRLLIDRYHSLRYIQRSKLEVTPRELIHGLGANAVAHSYEDMVFIIDSLRDLENVRDDKKAMELMNDIKNIREAGATIMIVHHSNKDGKNYEGSVNIKNSLDCMFKLKKLPSREGFISVGLGVEKERSGVRDCAFEINTNSLALHSVEVEVATMTPHESEFVDKATKALKDKGELKQGELLAQLGFRKDDKTARGLLDKFVDRYWSKNQEKKGSPIVYKLL